MGHDIGVPVYKNDHLACQKHCQNTPDCTHFTWEYNTAESLCRLKSSDEGRKLYVNGIISGRRECEVY